MAKGGFRHLVVVRDGELCGIISMRDIMQRVAPERAPGPTSARAVKP